MKEVPLVARGRERGRLHDVPDLGVNIGDFQDCSGEDDSACLGRNFAFFGFLTRDHAPFGAALARPIQRSAPGREMGVGR